MEQFKVSATSDIKKVAGAIAGVIRQGKGVEITSVGATAVNQAIKAVAIARGYVASQGYNLKLTPGFVDVIVGGEEKTGIKFIINVN